MKLKLFSLLLMAAAQASCTGLQRQAAGNLLVKYGERRGVLNEQDAADAREATAILFGPAAPGPKVDLTSTK